MTEPETIEAEVVEEMGQALEVHQPAPVSLFGTADPVAVVERATAAANALAAVIEAKKLYVQIRGKKHVTLEGWTLLGSMLGVFPVPEWSRPVEGGWEARVEARTRDGAVVGAAEAVCLRSEGKPWDKADEYAVRSMAQTRAASKALRLPLGFVMTLGGYEATSEPEMPRGDAPEVIIEGPDPLPPPRSWAKITEYVSTYDEGTHDLFFAYGDAARRYLYPGSVDTKSLSKEDRDALFQVTAQACMALCLEHDPAKFPPPSEEEIRKAWASVLEGVELALPSEEAEE